MKKMILTLAAALLLMTTQAFANASDMEAMPVVPGVPCKECVKNTAEPKLYENTNPGPHQNKACHLLLEGCTDSHGKSQYDDKGTQ